MTEINCIFCNKDLAENDRFPVLFKNRNFIVKIPKGSLMQGYLLLIPNRHVCSFAELNSEEMTDYLNIIKHINKIFYDEYKQVPITWENGSTRQDPLWVYPPSVDHAHLHILPHKFSQIAIDKINSDRHLKPVNITGGELQSYRESCYLLYTNPDEKAFISKSKVSIRQCIRRVIANQLQTPLAWNWRELPCDEIGKKTAVQLYGKFERLQEIIK